LAASSERDEATPLAQDDDRVICRWLAYSGSPVLVEELLYNRQNSLIVQSLHSRLGAEETNGDGFGLGWYGDQETPGVFRSIEPAWNDRNLRELSSQITSGLVFAHIRASTGSPVQQTNCHPFRHGRWLFMHNGFVDGLHEIKRDLALAVDPSLYPEIEGTTDTELLFHLALSFGLKDDPPQAVARAVGLIESTGREHGVEFPFQGTIAATDGECIWGFRYSSEGRSRSLFFSTDLLTLRQLYPDNEEIRGLDDESRLVVSEPLGDLPGVWNEVPESSYGVIQPGQDEMHRFEPIPA
jgi:glutamine amidotransferase